MVIGIRADGGKKIGMGHIMRTLVLAKELAGNHDVFYICKVDEPISDKYEGGIQKVKVNGFEIKLINESRVIDDLKKIQVDLLITDSYDVDEFYFDETKKLFNKTAYIDDVNLYSYNVDYLINQNINGLDLTYNTNVDTKLILGPQFIMLRDEFRNVEKKYIKDKPKDIMLTVGGSDEYYVTNQILSYVKSLNYNFHVVVGPSFNNNNSLKDFENERVRLYYSANMIEIMKNCDVAISACGSTLYELAVCGVPTLGIIVADNQLGLAKKMAELELIENVGWFNKLNKSFFVEAFTELCNNINKRIDMSEKAASVIDGQGVRRIVEILTENI